MCRAQMASGIMKRSHKVCARDFDVEIICLQGEDPLDDDEEEYDGEDDEDEDEDDEGVSVKYTRGMLLLVSA